MNKIDRIEQYMHRISEYRAELVGMNRGPYASTCVRLTKIADEMQEFINMVNSFNATSGMNVNKQDLTKPVGDKSLTSASSKSKRALYRSAIADWHECLKQLTGNDGLSEQANAIAEIALDWFEYRILKYCGKGKSNFRIRCSDIWRMIFAIGLAYTRSLCEDETGTVFMASYQQWKNAIATDATARDTFALPYIALTNLRAYPAVDTFTFGSDCVFIRELLSGGLNEMKNTEKYGGYEIPSDWFNQIRSGH